MSFPTILKYLTEEGPAAPKHANWKHPTVALILHYLISTVFLIIVHDLYIAVLISQYPHGNSNESGRFRLEEPNTQLAIGVLLYFVFLLSYRILQNSGEIDGGTTNPKKTDATTNIHHSSSSRNSKIIHKQQAFQIACLYEHTFLCNTTLFHGYLSIQTNRPLLAAAHLITVSIDQVLWYIDLTGFCISGFTKFPIGVAKYITWEDTSWATRITCTHHLWTIPLVGSMCGGIRLEAFPLSAVVMVVNVLLSRWLTPRSILYHSPAPVSVPAPQKGESSSANASASISTNHTEEHKYLNVNLSHELWKDITFDCLQIRHDDPPVGLYLWRLLWRWQVFNGVIFFVVLRPFSKYFLEQ